MTVGAIPSPWGCGDEVSRRARSRLGEGEGQTGNPDVVLHRNSKLPNAQVAIVETLDVVDPGRWEVEGEDG